MTTMLYVVFALFIVYILIDGFKDFAQASGTVWQKLLAVGKNSATILWARFTGLVAALAGALAFVADYLNAPGVGDAIKSGIGDHPQYVAAFSLFVAVMTEFARRRTL